MQVRPADDAVSMRPMSAADVPQAQALTASFGWPHRREDWALMQSLGEGVVAERAGRVAATALCWRFGTDRATLGLIGVAAALQGQGIGRRMMADLVARLEGRSVVLHSTRAGMKLYAAFGFEPTGTVVQHQGAVSQPGLQELPDGVRLRPLARADLPAMAALDRHATGADRSAALAALGAVSSGIALDDRGTLAGFALVRRFGHGQVLGPLVAPDLPGARAMAAHLLGQRTGQFMRTDVPKSCGLAPWLAGLGLAEVGTVIRMVRGPDAPPDPRGARTFSLANQAFG